METKFVEELRWRGLLHDAMPGTEELLNREVVTGYIGFDPTADSLHIGHLSQVFTLMRFQKAGHKPIALIGGATGMVGDPSGKSAERNLLDEEALNKNIAGIRKQLEKLLNFSSGSNSAELVNNYDWMKDQSFLHFIRDVGKHITVNYMMAKDSVKNRLDTGMSFTEFSYQLLQGHDFYTLWKEKNCKLQMGGSDQWGNITTGTELIRRRAQGEAYALTTQLVRKADGTKFGKTESGSCGSILLRLRLTVFISFGSIPVMKMPGSGLRISHFCQRMKLKVCVQNTKRILENACFKKHWPGN